MNRLCLMLLACSACVNLDPSAARAYPCTSSDDCRGGWVCGLEGVCHAPEPGAWRCTPDAGSALCFGWHCGLEGVCYSKDEPVERLCSFVRETSGERSDCPTSWACGLENRCHAPVPGPWLCASDAGSASCFGWHCGLEGRCYSQDAGVQRPCDFDRERDGGRADCDLGWRCGLENVCHPIGLSAPLRCESDVECEGEWRCGPQHVCLDPGIETPQLSSTFEVAVERLSPRLVEARPDVVAVSSNGTLFGWLHGTTLTRFDHVRPGLKNDGGLSFHRVATLSLSSAPSQLAAGLDELWLASGSRVQRVVVVDAGLQLGPVVDVGFSVGTLASSPSGMIARGGSELVRLVNDGGPIVSLSSVSDGGPQLIDLDVATGTSPPDFAGAWVLTPSGLRELTETTSAWRTYSAVNVDGGALPFSFGDATQVWSFSGLVFVADSSGGVTPLAYLGAATTTLENRWPRCLPCGTAGSPIRPVLVSSSITDWACQVDGGQATIRSTLTTCDALTTVPREPRQWGRRGELGWVDGYGRIGFGTSAHVMGYANLAATSTLSLHTLGNRVLVVTPSNGVHLDSIGLVAWQGATLPGVAVRNASSFVTTANQTTSIVSTVLDVGPTLLDNTRSARQLATLTQPSSSTPGAATFATRRDTRWLLVSNGDALYAAQVGPLLDAVNDGGSPPALSLQPKLAPSPRLPILSVTADVSPPDSGTLVTGWVLTTNRASYFESLTERSWVDTPVVLPAGEWVTLLSNDARHRVAYADGTLRSLPSRLVVSEPFAGGVRSSQFATAAGVDFALTSQGLFALGSNPDGGVLGAWRAIALPALTNEAGFPADELENAQLAGVGTSIYIATKHAGLYRLTIDAGAP